MNRVTLISLDNSLDNLYVYDRIKVGQHALLHALIRVFNRLNYPATATVSNTELQRKSGIESNHFLRIRESLTKFLIDPNDPESWVVSYQTGEKQSAGQYTFNYSYLNLTTTLPQVYHKSTTTLPQDTPQVYHDFTNGHPKVPKNVNDHRKNRSDQKDQTKKDQTRPDALSQNLSKIENIDYEKVLVGFSYKGISEGELKYIKEYYAQNKLDLIKRIWGDKVIEALSAWEKENGY